MSVSGSQQEQCTLLDLNSRSIREADCSVKEHILDFFCVNKDTKTIKIVRLGAYLASNGKVRTVLYGTD